MRTACLVAHRSTALYLNRANLMIKVRVQSITEINKAKL